MPVCFSRRAYSLSKKYFSTSCQASRNTRRRGKSHRRRTKVRQGTLDEVSKNAFVEPFSAPQNYVTNHPREFMQQPNLVLHFCGAWVYRQSESKPMVLTQLVEKVFFDKLKTSRNTRRQGNAPDRRTKVRQGSVDAVSKNAFPQP